MFIYFYLKGNAMAVEKCGYCKGSKKVDCDCQGSRGDMCPACGGKEVHPCPACGGTGKE